MPLIKVQTSLSAPAPDAVDTLLTTLSTELSLQLGKSEAYVMTALEADTPMTFGGTADEPVGYVEIKNIGTLTPTQTEALSQAICKHLEQQLGIPQARTYIAFADSERHLWGWNGKTFA